MKALGQNGLNFIANKYKELRAALSNKVDKVSGKSLSTNDYDSTAKAKVDAIPANPKYTDTTYDLSKYAEKSDISRCKTKGYNTSSTWQSLSTTRDLEDWIGDFDKRTRESRVESWLYDNPTLIGDSRPLREWSVLKLGNIVILSLERTMRGDELNRTIGMPSSFYPSKDTFFDFTALNRNGNNMLMTWYLSRSGSFEAPNMSSRDLWDYSVHPFTVMYQI